MTNLIHIVFLKSFDMELIVKSLLRHFHVKRSKVIQDQTRYSLLPLSTMNENLLMGFLSKLFVCWPANIPDIYRITQYYGSMKH